MSDETNIDHCEHGVPKDKKCGPCLLAAKRAEAAIDDAIKAPEVTEDAGTVIRPMTAMEIQVLDEQKKAEAKRLEVADKEKAQAEAHKLQESQGGDKMTESEAILGFIEMLQSQPLLIQFSKRHRHPPMDTFLREYCQVNGLKMPREHWRKLTKVPTPNWRDKS